MFFDDGRALTVAAVIEIMARRCAFAQRQSRRPRQPSLSRFEALISPSCQRPLAGPCWAWQWPYRQLPVPARNSNGRPVFLAERRVVIAMRDSYVVAR